VSLSHENVAIALAVMLRVPGREPVKSRLHAALGPHASTLLYRCFVLDTLDAAAQVRGTEAIVAFAPAAAAPAMAGLAPGMRRLAQRGDDLGARMANLVTDLLEAGHSAALVTGSDLPALPAARFVEAARALAGGDADVVLGPSEDGGYYLIGLTRSAPALFTDMRWSAPDVLAVTCARAQRLGLRVHRLPPWYDVDTPADLVRLRDDLASAVGAPAPGTVAWRTRRWLSAFPG
jgi:rSAM/selenodomain-associated transferase 1